MAFSKENSTKSWKAEEKIIYLYLTKNRNHEKNDRNRGNRNVIRSLQW